VSSIESRNFTNFLRCAGASAEMQYGLHYLVQRIVGTVMQNVRWKAPRESSDTQRRSSSGLTHFVLRMRLEVHCVPPSAVLAGGTIGLSAVVPSAATRTRRPAFARYVADVELEVHFLVTPVRARRLSFGIARIEIEMAGRLVAPTIV